MTRTSVRSECHEKTSTLVYINTINSTYNNEEGVDMHGIMLGNILASFLPGPELDSQC